MEAVGVGCIWFAYRRVEDDIAAEKFTPAGHLVEIKKALEGVDNVSNVRVVGKGNTIAGWAGINEESERNNFFPIYDDVLIEFDIFMPHRLQQKYLRAERHLEAENFHVSIYYDQAMPIAYIYYSVAGTNGDARRHSPSSAVVFIRKYLADRLENNDTIEFNCLGPSPFHADIFLSEPDSAEVDSGISADAIDLTKAGDGYRTLVFNVAGTPGERIQRFQIENQKTLASFYSIVRWNNYASELRSAVLTGASDLLDSDIPRGYWGRYRYWRRYASEIDAVFKALLNEKMNRATTQRVMSGIYDDEEVSKESVLFRFLVEEREDHHGNRLLDEDIRQLLVMLEERRRGYFANTATLFAGLAGGVLGALLGASLSFYLGSVLPHSAKAIPAIIAPTNQSGGGSPSN